MVTRFFRALTSQFILWSILSVAPSEADQPAISPWTSALLSEYAYRKDVNAYCLAVVAQIAQKPANFGKVVMEAVNRAPEFREAILAATSQAFPGFADNIGFVLRGGLPSPAPSQQFSTATNIKSNGLSLWSGEVELGGSRSTGNTDRDQASGAFKLKHQYGSWLNEAKLHFDYARKDDETSARRFVSSLQSRYGASKGLYAFLFVQYQDDQFSGFDFEVTESGGAGYHIVDSERVTWRLELGPGGRQSVVSESHKTESEFVGRASSEFVWRLSESAKITNDTSVVTGSDRTTTENTIALSTTIIGQLLGRASFQVRHSSSPVTETKATDTLSKFSLAYQF
jgi:putative salt-induced outer membrane protein